MVPFDFHLLLWITLQITVHHSLRFNSCGLAIQTVKAAVVVCVGLYVSVQQPLQALAL